MGNGKFGYAIPFILFQFASIFINENGTNFALPYMQTDFNQSKSVTQWIQTVYLVAQASLAIPLAKVAENMGQIHAMYMFISISCIISVSLIFIKNFYLFCVLRFISGAVNIGQNSCKNAVLRKLAPPGKAQAFLQYNMIIVYSFSVVIPLLNGIIVGYNWRIIYIVSSMTSFCTLVALIPFTNPPKPISKSSFDIFGTLWLFLGVTCIDLAFTFLAYKSWVATGLLFVFSVVFFVIFYFVEKKAKDPVLPLFLMKNPVLDLVLTNICMNFWMSGMMYVFPQTMDFYGRQSWILGSLMAVAGVGTAIVSFVMPAISKRVLNKTCIVVSQALNSVCFVLFLVFGQQVKVMLGIYIVHSIIGSVANQLIFPMTLLSAPQQFSSQISAVPATGRTISSSMAGCLSAMVLQMGYKAFQSAESVETGEKDNEAWSNAMRICFGIYFGLHLAGSALILFRTGQSKNEIGKKAYNPAKVRSLSFSNQKAVQMEETKEEVGLLKSDDK